MYCENVFIDKRLSQGLKKVKAYFTMLNDKIIKRITEWRFHMTHGMEDEM